MRGIRHHNYKEVCVKCGDKGCAGDNCDEINTNNREYKNIAN